MNIVTLIDCTTDLTAAKKNGTNVKSIFISTIRFRIHSVYALSKKTNTFPLAKQIQIHHTFLNEFITNLFKILLIEQNTF